MFRKLISNLAFSPALVGQLGFYARRLKKEEATRRVGLVFTALALVVQSFAVFSPPEAANAASARDLVYGGVSSVEDFLSHYDRNDRGLKDIANYIGITSSEIKAVSHKKLFTVGSNISWGRQAVTSTANGEIKHDAFGTTVYSHPMSVLYKRGSASQEYGYVGYSAKIGWFAITPGCGNFVTTRIPTPPEPTPKAIPMCTVPGKTHLKASDDECKTDPTASCAMLRVTPLGKTHQFDVIGSVSNGAKIVSYTYTVKRDTQTVHTKTITSSDNSNSYIYSQDKQGTYTVSATVNTTIGERTSSDCIKTFTIPPPEMCPQNPSILKTDPECQPCPGDSTLWIKDEKCSAVIIQTKTASNITQGNVDASTVIAQASDKIMFVLETSNTGKAATEVEVIENLDDVIEYASVIDTGGGVYDKNSKTITWPKTSLEPNEKQLRIFNVRLLDTIPTMGTGVSDGSSYDCKMINSFGNTVEINVDCPIEKQIVEQTVSELPHTGPRENMIFSAIVLSITVYFYARSRQMKKEIRLIRRDLNAGTI
ncbi:hypothetical protein EOL96_05300 [Candidatus Saccharibacteria bacterium]|nr:hypothetical protein [Candidatus Saccharibacteria bacterium]